MKEIFWEAFNGAEESGVETIIAIASILFLRWRDNIEELTEFVMVVNHKSWYHYEHNHDEFSKVYTDLYYKYYEEAIDYLESKDRTEDISYFIRTLD